MEYVKLGNTGLDVSRLCLGCMSFGDPETWVHKWTLDEENSRPIIRKALYVAEKNGWTRCLNKKITGCLE
ncbi:hypothetical protein [Lacrimispora brassicae]